MYFGEGCRKRLPYRIEVDIFAIYTLLFEEGVNIRFILANLKAE